MKRMNRLGRLALLLALSSIGAQANAEALFNPDDRVTRKYDIVFDSSSYASGKLALNGQAFRLGLEGEVLQGRYYPVSGLVALIDEQRRRYALMSFSPKSAGVWQSCWGSDADAVRACGEGTVSAQIRLRERAANDPAPAAGRGEQPAPAPTPPQASAGNPGQQPAPAPAPRPAPAPQPAPQPAPEPVREPTPEPAREPARAPAPTTDVASVRCEAPTAQVKAALLAATNRSRASAQRCGAKSYGSASALTWNDTLAGVARRHSVDMGTNNFFSHTGSDGLKVWDRAVAAGYSYRNIGENIAGGQNTVGVVQQGWMDSPGHCENVMKPEYVEMGAACVVYPNAQYRKYWTVVFGTKR